MIALTRMRLAGFVHGGRVTAPLITVLAVLFVLYSGGPSSAAAAYSYSAACLFPILAWLTKLVLDTEPDAQRRLARLAVGPVREAAAGLLAATLLAVGVCALGMLAPWPFRAIRGPEPGSLEPSLPAGVLLGVLAHLLAVIAAVALGALASRAVTRRIMPGVAILVSGSILTVVLGLSDSIAPWLAPPVMATSRALSGRTAPSAADLTILIVWATLWCAVVLTGYGRLRRDRS
ncbi:hypothetical protein Aph02nite_50470 [Actinoplanes philippinensis]|uniref:ABC-2 type transport system permease protein n=1 Tax=Actinoplanes philippinensis TaxID=35752 RepID=A0A1I2IRI5_9ACTN|nr:hypothetical protein [Actinoplanes philippinensis]GIE79097.1 hypothetical protein Aph02nite_50470 [Actinoplanes philippinensis]SFF44258.1 hypothetical protein SAMN05421541_110312 [Actinoplanes philippinensis]